MEAAEPGQSGGVMTVLARVGEESGGGRGEGKREAATGAPWPQSLGETLRATAGQWTATEMSSAMVRAGAVGGRR